MLLQQNHENIAGNFVYIVLFIVRFTFRMKMREKTHGLPLTFENTIISFDNTLAALVLWRIFLVLPYELTFDYLFVSPIFTENYNCFDAKQSY